MCGSTRGQMDPLQLVEHSGDAAGIVPAVADVPGRATLHHLSFLRIVMCVGSHTAEVYYSKCGLSSVGRVPDSQSREPGFESPLLPFRSLGIFFHSTTPQSTQLYK